MLLRTRANSPDAPVYYMAGEITRHRKELWTNLLNRDIGGGEMRSRLDSYAEGDPASTGYFDLSQLAAAYQNDPNGIRGQFDNRILALYEELRDAGIFTISHDDMSFAEFAPDGRPVAAPGDGRFLMQNMQVELLLGPHDLRGLDFGNPDFTLTDQAVQDVISKGPVRRPLNGAVAHLGGVGNLTRPTPQHLEMLQLIMSHPLFPHYAVDASWMPVIRQTMMDGARHGFATANGDMQYQSPFVDLAQTGKVMYGSDAVNEQKASQLFGAFYEQQPSCGHWSGPAPTRPERVISPFISVARFASVSTIRRRRRTGAPTGPISTRSATR